MKKLPIHIIMRGLCVIVVLTAITAVFWVADAVRHHSSGAITVLPIMNSRQFMFGHDQIWDVSVEFAGHIEMEHHNNRQIDAGARTAFAHVSTTGQHYFDVVFLPFASGSPWGHDDENSIIISESLAWALFGSMDVVGLSTLIGDDSHIVTGVVRDMAQSGHLDGFAWMPRPDSAQENYATILHFIPDSYNRLQAHADVVRILGLMNRRADDYLIVDVNGYIAGITLRGQILVSLAGLAFVFVMTRFAYRIAKYEEGKQRWVWVVGIATGCIAVLALLVPYMSFDLWVPAFFPDGWRGYAQLLFNIGPSISRQYLPNHLSYLYGLNTWANWGFGVGILGIIGALVIPKKSWQ